MQRLERRTGRLVCRVCGTLGEVYGWHVGFSAAGIGMLLGLVIYITGRRHLPPDPPRSERATLPFSALWQPAYRPLLQLMTMIAGLIVTEPRIAICEIVFEDGARSIFTFGAMVPSLSIESMPRLSRKALLTAEIAIGTSCTFS